MEGCAQRLHLHRTKSEVQVCACWPTWAPAAPSPSPLHGTASSACSRPRIQVSFLQQGLLSGWEGCSHPSHQHLQARGQLLPSGSWQAGSIGNMTEARSWLARCQEGHCGAGTTESAMYLHRPVTCQPAGALRSLSHLLQVVSPPPCQDLLPAVSLLPVVHLAPTDVLRT